MNLPSILFLVYWLLRDTYRQSLASRAFWLLLGLSGLCILLCLSVHIEGFTAHRPPGEIELFGRDRQPFTGLNRGEGRLSLAFGAVSWRISRDGETEVRFLQALLARWAIGAVGIVLALVWTAGFLPDFLRPSSATVLLAKPVPRWLLLVGKFLGVVLFVTCHFALFVIGTWAALGFRTGYWPPAYLMGVPLLATQFAVLYGFSALLAVWARNEVICIAGALLCYAVCAAVNVQYLRSAATEAVGVDAIALPVASAASSTAFPSIVAPLSSAATTTAAAGFSEAPVAVGLPLRVTYWVLPKPTDLGVLLGHSVESRRHFRDNTTVMPENVVDLVSPELSMLTSLLFTGVLLAVAARRFTTRDY